jgi:uncharacterized protein (TIRG00374 family)
MKKNVTISLVVGILVSAVAFYFAFRRVPFTELGIYLLSINYLWIVPSAALILATFGLRAIRWRIILSTTKQLDIWQVFHPMMIGFMLNCILPGRVGEIARPVILQKKEGVPFSTGLATVAAERVFDLILLVLLFAAVLAKVNIDVNLDVSFGGYHLNRETLMTAVSGMIKISLVLIAGVVVVSLKKAREVIAKIIMGSPSMLFVAGQNFRHKLQDKICRPLIGMMENFAAGFAMIKHPKTICLCLLLSFFIWCINAFAFFVMAQGCPGIDISYLEIFAVMIIICFFIALPSVPGFWGLWEAGGIFALALFAVPAKDAAGFTLANHALQILPVIFVGLGSAVYLGVDVWKLSYRDTAEPASGQTVVT